MPRAVTHSHSLPLVQEDTAISKPASNANGLSYATASVAYAQRCRPTTLLRASSVSLADLIHLHLVQLPNFPRIDSQHAERPFRSIHSTKSPTPSSCSLRSHRYAFAT